MFYNFDFSVREALILLFFAVQRVFLPIFFLQFNELVFQLFQALH